MTAALVVVRARAYNSPPRCAERVGFAITGR